MPATALYGALLLLSLAARFLEERLLNEDPLARGAMPLRAVFRFVPLAYVFNMGTLGALTQATLGGFRKGEVWEVTPKSGTTPGSPGHGSKKGVWPAYVTGTSAVAAAAALGPTAFILGHVLWRGCSMELWSWGVWVGTGLAADRLPGLERMVPLARRLVSGTRREAA